MNDSYDGSLSPMEVTVGDATTLVTIDFAAPIPAGNETLLVTIERKDAGFFDASEVEVAVDLTARVVYADYAYWSVLQERGWPPAPFGEDPVGVLGPGWVPKRALRGRVAGALVSTRDGSDRTHVRTLLHVVPETEQSYR